MAKLGTPGIVLNLPANVAQLILHGRHVVSSIKAAPKLSSVVPAATKLSTDLDTLEASEAEAQKGGEGAVDTRDADLSVVKFDFELVKAGVIAVIAGDPLNAALYTDQSGLSSKKKGGRKKTKPDVLFPSLGVAHVFVKAVKRGSSYEWQISSDGGKSFAAAGTTTRADQLFPGLTPGATYQVRWRTTTGRTTSDWNQVFVFMMH